MSGNWQKALYPVKDRERRSQPGGGMKRIEEGFGAKLREFTTVGIGGGGAAVADAGVMLPRFAVLCALSALSGAEELGGIPGTVGGALTMNAGAYGRAIGDIVEWVEIVDPEGALYRVAA